jgi:16S rRNA (guanine966-N2)-methyltransferase
MAGARVLDAYAGTGAVGLEALSRGAAHVTFVEKDARARALIAGNLERCGVTGGYTIERGPVADVLSRLAPDYDVVFLDPPYDEADLGLAVTLGVGRLAADGICVLEHASRREPPSEPAPTRRLTSGDSALAFYLR